MAREVTINADVDPQVLEEVRKLAASRGLPAAALIGEALQRYVEYERWFLEKVEEGKRAADEGRVMSQEELEAELRRRYG